MQGPPEEDFEREGAVDDEQTLVAQNPFADIEDDSEEADEPTRVMRVKRPSSRPPISSFGAPRSSRPPEGPAEESAEEGEGEERPSLYERLLRSGALDEVQAAGGEKAQKAAAEGRAAEAAEEAGDRDSRVSFETLRDSEVDLLAVRDSDIDAVSNDDTSDLDHPTPLARPKTRAMPPPPSEMSLPSVMVDPERAGGEEATDRIRLPSPQQMSSLAPLGSVPAAPPSERRRGAGVWAVAAALVLGVGLGALLTWNRGGSDEAEATTATAAAPTRTEPLEPEPAVQTAQPPQVAEVPAPEAQQPPVEVESEDTDETRAEAKAPEPVDEEGEEPAGEARQKAQATASEREPAERRERRRARRQARAAKTPAAAPTKAETPESDEPAPEQAAEPQVAAKQAEPEPTAEPTLPRQLREQDDTPAAELPETPPREQVVAAMKSVEDAVRECAGGKKGLADVTVTVRNQGYVSYAVVGGNFAGTPEGSCIARAVKQAEFPRFTKPMLRVNYPFQL